jgi:cytochrome c5
VSTQDRRFFELFSMVLGGLVLFTILIFFIARHISAGTQGEWVKEQLVSGAEQQERLAPVGRVAVTGESAPESAAPAQPAPAGGTAPAGEPGGTAAPAGDAAAAAQPAAMSGEQVYNTVCFACHATGAAGAPKPDDKADWAPRIAQGEDTLVKHAIEGYQGQKGIMPPKGGRADIPDEAVKAAVEFMMSKAQ